MTADKLEKLHEKDGEILQLKQQIRGKDRELKSANQTLFSSEETIDVSIDGRVYNTY